MKSALRIALIHLRTAAGAAATAFEVPSQQALVPNLVPREHLTNAISFNTLLFQFATITGPALAGLLVRVNMMFFMGGPQLGELEVGLKRSSAGRLTLG